MSAFRSALVQHFTDQGLAAAAEELADGLLLRSMTFRIEDSPVERLKEAESIFAFAFGNRADRFANLSGGPVNRSLAEVASKLSIRYVIPDIRAQWEIGEEFAASCASPLPKTGSAYSYGQKFDRIQGKPVYQSTFSFLQAIKGNLPPRPAPRLPVIVVAHAHHYARCCRMTEEAGYEPLSVQSMMPSEYDPESAQIWTTSPLLFALHTLSSTITHWKEQSAKSAPGSPSETGLMQPV